MSIGDSPGERVFREFVSSVGLEGAERICLRFGQLLWVQPGWFGRPRHSVRQTCGSWCGVAPLDAGFMSREMTAWTPSRTRHATGFPLKPEDKDSKGKRFAERGRIFSDLCW